MDEIFAGQEAETSKSALSVHLRGPGRRMSITERLQQERKVHLERVAELDQAIEVLTKHPDFESVINTLAKFM